MAPFEVSPRARPPYTGAARRLAISIDLGTTYSGACYCILDPGSVPEITLVNSFDGRTSTKVPTVLYYHKVSGDLLGAGYTTSFDEKEIDEGDVLRVEWFKALLRPSATTEDKAKPITKPLPEGKTPTDVMSDFLGYMYRSTKSYLVDRRRDGQSLWDSFEDRIDIILTHPNGFDQSQKDAMRQAAFSAYLVSDWKAAQTRIHLLSEAAANLHYCLDCGLEETAIEGDHGFTIIDAGGGTVDITSYRMKGGVFEEIAVADCLYNGTIFVTKRAEEFLETHFKDSKYSEHIPKIIDRFSREFKDKFKSPSDDFSFPIPGCSEDDPGRSVEAGVYKLKGTDVENFLRPAIDEIQDALRKTTRTAETGIKTALLVGGFGGNSWVYEKIKSRLEKADVELSRPDIHTNKSVAHGALAWHIDHEMASKTRNVTGVAHQMATPPSTPVKPPTDDKPTKRKRSEREDSEYSPGAAGSSTGETNKKARRLSTMPSAPPMTRKSASTGSVNSTPDSAKKGRNPYKNRAVTVPQ